MRRFTEKPDDAIAEILGRRTRSAKHWDLGGGKARIVAISDLMHYPDAQGKLRTIDHRIVDVGGGIMGVRKAPYDLDVLTDGTGVHIKAKNGPGEAVIRLSKIDGAPVGVAPVPTFRGSGISWEVAPGIRVSQTARSTGLTTVHRVMNSVADVEWEVRGKDLDRLQINLDGIRSHDNAEGAALARKILNRRRRLEIIDTADTRADGNEDVITLREQWTGRVSDIDPITRKKRWINTPSKIALPVFLMPPDIDVDVTSDDDDGHQINSGGSWNANPGGTFYGGKYSSTYYYAGFRFRAIGLPGAATIDGATLNAYAVVAAGSVTGLYIFGGDEADAPTWATEKPSDMTETTASTHISVKPAIPSYAVWTITDIVQEQANVDGFGVGSDVRYVIRDDPAGGADNYLGFQDYSANKHSLEVDYTESGGPTYTLTADGGTYTLAGTAANLEHHRTLDTEAGSVALAGSAANLEQHRAIDAETGSIALTGQDATLTYTPVGGYTLPCDAGAYALAGTSANLEQHRVLGTEAGAVALAGTAANLEQHRVVDAGAGAVALTGTDANLEQHRALDTEAGSVALTGTAANLEQHRVLDVAAGAVALAGTDVTLTATGSYSLGIEAGSYSLAGTAAGLEQHRVLDAAAGAVSTSGADVTLTYTPSAGYTLAVDGGSYSLSGTASGLFYDRLLGMDAGAYAYTGKSATFTRTAAELEGRISGPPPWEWRLFAGKWIRTRGQVVRNPYTKRWPWN